MTDPHSTADDTPPAGDDWPAGLEWDDVLDYFPYDTVRDAQSDGMKTALDAASTNGYLVMEGACGTGKTLLALAPLLAMVRNDNTAYERVAVVTSVKQQQRAFESEVTQINETLRAADSRPVSAVSLVGKADVCPYVQQGEIGTEEIYGECERLRDNTSAIVAGETGSGRSASSLAAQGQSTHAGDYDTDPHYAFDSTVPHDTETDTDYCPYYAQHLANNATATDGDDAPATVPFELESAGMMTADRMLQMAGERGTCPHSVMGDSLGAAELVIANYYHIFEPTTVSTFTQELMDDSTLLIVDEAHNLIPRVRDLLSTDRTLSTVSRARAEASQLRQLLQLDDDALAQLASAVAQQGSVSAYTDDADDDDDTVDPHTVMHDVVTDDSSLAETATEFLGLAENARSLLDRLPLTTAQLDGWIAFLDALDDTVDTVLTRHFDSEVDTHDDPPHELTIPLRDPAAAGKRDKLSQWMRLYDDPASVLDNLATIGTSIEALQSQLRAEVLDDDDPPEFRSAGLASFIDDWQSLDNTQYFRTLELERDPDAARSNDAPSAYAVTLRLFNCIPREEISQTLQSFGAGVLMSATVEPLHIYREVVGLDRLEAAGRPVYERQYGLGFPEQNRQSFAVDAPAFKYNNKGRARTAVGSPNTDNEVRQTYAQAIFDTIQATPGNVLVCMPSYQEAWWAGTLLKQHPETNAETVYVDESSTNQETEAMKQAFFEADNAVLVTGALGTLTEGVDYKGDRLAGVVCCGVPIQNTNTPYATAIEQAFKASFGDANGFEYAFTLPAVHKTRQALGRVIRDVDDIGVRVLVDTRYTTPDTTHDAPLAWEQAREKLARGLSWRQVRSQLHIRDSEWDNVYRFLSQSEQTELRTVSPDSLSAQLDAFWAFHNDS